MIDEKTLQENFKAFCEANGLVNPRVEIQEYNFKSFDDFFAMNEDIWNEVTNADGEHENCWKNEEELSFERDIKFHNDFPEPPENLEITNDIFEAVSSGYIMDETLWEGYIFENLTYGDLSDVLKEDVKAWWFDLSVDELNDFKEVLEALEIDDADDEYSISSLIEDMAYWTIYFSPKFEVFDWNAAYQCGLVPFKYKEKFYLGYGGCGMDLSPKLNKYQAIVSKTIPRDSLAFSDPNYFKYVAHMEASEILEMCKLDSPKVILTADEKQDKEEGKEE